MELDIIIVGAGLAGLAAANGLRRAGHRVRMFERSSFSREVGAGITVSPQAALVLQKWGFDQERAKTVTTEGLHFRDGKTLEMHAGWGMTKLAKGSNVFTLYRPDYHAELLRLATAVDAEGPPVSLTLGAQVIRGDAESGTIYLADGTSHSADLVIGADGINSVVREVVVPGETKVTHSGGSAYRFMGRTSNLPDDPEVQSLYQSKKNYWSAFTRGTSSQDPDFKFFIWYGVQSETLQNYCLMYPSGDEPLSARGTTQEELRKSLMKDMAGLHPVLHKICSTVEDIKPWRLVYHEPLRTWINSRFLLVGDAAHPIHPRMGQGVNTSIEDGAALQILFSNIQNPDDLKQRMLAFERIRLPRTAVIQILSTIDSGQEATRADKMKPYLEALGKEGIRNKSASNAFAMRYDVWKDAEDALEMVLGKYEGTGTGIA